jgi:hypothetical protein
MFLEWSSATSQNSLCADLSSLLQPATWTASWRAFTSISSEIIAVQTTTAVIAGKLHSVSYAVYLFPPAQVIHIQRSSLAHRPHSMRGKHHNNLLSYRRLLQDDDQDLRSPPQDNKPPTSPSALRIHGTRQRAPPMQRASITFGNPSRGKYSHLASSATFNDTKLFRHPNNHASAGARRLLSLGTQPTTDAVGEREMRSSADMPDTLSICCPSCRSRPHVQ